MCMDSYTAVPILGLTILYAVAELVKRIIRTDDCKRAYKDENNPHDRAARREENWYAMGKQRRA